MTETQHQESEEVREVRPIDEGVMTAISRAELDHAITTARAYPRSIKRFRDECLQIATLTEAVADECIYGVPRGGKVIEGPSARMAEIVASSWGNARYGARVVDVGPEFVTAQGVFHDLERNVQITMEVRRRITSSSGKRYNADMIGTTGNAACSIAMRNAVFRGIPKALWNDVYLAARRTAVGDAKTLANKRSDALSYLQKLGASHDNVLAMLGVEGLEDIGLDELATLRGLANAIKDGGTTVEDAFPNVVEKPQQSAPASKKGVEGLEGRVLGGDADGEAAK